MYNAFEEKKYLIRGVYEKIGSDKVRITELPVGTWTDDYKQYLETLMDTTTKTGKKKKPVIKSYIDMSTDTLVDITVTFPVGVIAKMETTLVEYGCSQLEKTLKLYTTNTTTNMHAFTEEEKLKKYNTVYDIINDYMNCTSSIMTWQSRHSKTFSYNTLTCKCSIPM